VVVGVIAEGGVEWSANDEIREFLSSYRSHESSSTGESNRQKQNGRETGERASGYSASQSQQASPSEACLHLSLPNNPLSYLSLLEHLSLHHLPEPSSTANSARLYARVPPAQSAVSLIRPRESLVPPQRYHLVFFLRPRFRFPAASYTARSIPIALSSTCSVPHRTYVI
jgi:hypothetical protein